jgi:hypothetical protein
MECIQVPWQRGPMIIIVAHKPVNGISIPSMALWHNDIKLRPERTMLGVATSSFSFLLRNGGIAGRGE